MKIKQIKPSFYSDNSVTLQYDNVALESEGQEHELRKRNGTLYFGVKPNGDVCGQNVSESSLRDVSRAVYESIRPQIYPAIEEVILGGKHLIKVEFNGNNTPYSAAGRYYLRTADEDREVTPEELKSFFVSNEYHEICIHPGMITIYSPGEYASNHKPEDYMKGNYESVIRNATIAKILYLNKSIEQFGSGFKRINSLCKDAGKHDK